MALKEHTRKDLELKFRNVHALIKKNWPISDITWLTQLDRAKGLYHSKTYDKMTAATCDGASNMMGCKTGLVTRLQECYPEVEEIASDREVEIESEREIQSNREGERDSEENRDESDVDSDGEIDSESEFEQSEDETFRNVNKFVEIEDEMEYN